MAKRQPGHSSFGVRGMSSRKTRGRGRGYLHGTALCERLIDSADSDSASDSDSVFAFLLPLPSPPQISEKHPHQCAVIESHLK